MVILTVKHATEVQFLFNVPIKTEVSKVKEELRKIYNARLKVERLATEIDQLSQFGTMLPENMQGLNEDQFVDLKLTDPWIEKCVPSGGSIVNKDIYSRRNGHAPNENMKKVLTDTIEKAKAMISKNLVDQKIEMTLETVQEAISVLKGAVMIVYPMGLPPHDPIRMEFEDREDLTGQQASKLVIPEFSLALWWANKELHDEKLLSDYCGKNDRTKLAVKIQRTGMSAPAREPVVTEAQQKELMARAYRRQEELKKLDQADDDDYLKSEWADSGALKRSLGGFQNIRWGPR